ncbi:MAG: glutathione peroxidase [Bacteroidales bacterium]|nr:glutathione peroxidase [Bacteroidales bacterium]
MNIYDIIIIQRHDERDNEVSMLQFKGQVMLIVNTATGCGLTPQYTALETLYRKYKDQGFVILDFPCNQFMEQANGDDEAIHSFCTLNYDTTFPRFKKIEFNGPNEAPLYSFLKQAVAKRESKASLKNFIISISSRFNGKSKGDNDIQWNFEKFLVDRQGRVVHRFAPTITPEEIDQQVKSLL